MEQHITFKEMMKEKNFAIMDIEYIQTSKTHRCIRKMYILGKDGYTDMELEFYPCKPYKDLEKFHQRSFRFCQNHIHKLSYNPTEKYAPPCRTVLVKVKAFIVYNSIDFILYKGGTIEKDLCSELCIPSYNMECVPELEKVQSHDPQTEVNLYYNQLVKLGYIF